MKTTTAFNALAANRKATSLAKPFAVKSLNKDGSVSRAAVSVHTVAATQAEADAIKARMESQNPGRQFVVVPNN